MKVNSRKPRGLEALMPTAQMFHGLGKGIGRGRGPRLAEMPEGQPVENREKTEVEHGPLATV
jgi:hypothetical protein